MKTHLLVLMTALMSVSCNGQKTDTDKTEFELNNKVLVEQPKGSWKVEKEFDEHGNMIRYDSIYSWSSNREFNQLSKQDRDSLLQSFKSRFFTNFSGFENQGFETLFTEDSLFSNHFFNDDFFGSDFGRDFMDIDNITQQMIKKQREFLEKYQADFIEIEEE
ncbi:hypothetical protein [Aequorivita viscosa]|uniref:Uncharacterized protein n=1 Tax=Aequorivita viscosa TaxID=797419 RepID=A0A1M6H891_9FLAO|nr:hypothetical protein [Aequorivita viscosa]SDW89176.1 hypothetical protein SAMN05216556_1124 [Aequorivita viscosa]SHJ18293.1 hypothetical protein SAMN04487908_1114 [Aequorivita viscosa]